MTATMASLTATSPPARPIRGGLAGRNPAAFSVVLVLSLALLSPVPLSRLEAGACTFVRGDITGTLPGQTPVVDLNDGADLLAFLYIARGSAGEVRSMLTLGSRRPYLSNLKSEISNLVRLAESCSRQIRAWADSLQNSDIAGPRHLNDKSRADYNKRQARKTGAADFQQLLAQNLPPEHPLHPKNRPGRGTAPRPQI